MPASDRPATDWLEAVKDAERRGELLTAVDLAEQGLAERPDDLWLKHRAVLALARAGATEEAARRFERYGLEATDEDDIAALGARIAKDIALETTEEGRRAETVRALALYRSIHARTGGYYAAINAATLSLVAGQPEQARLLARAALDALAGNDERSYYAAATEGEAHLLLGDERAARRALERAASLHGGDYSSLATTRRQLRLVCALTGTDPAIIRILAGPGVAHFCGHRIAAAGAPGRFPAEAEQGVADRIDAELTRDTPRYAYGSLASGADIMWAEALLARGAELHIVLPFVRDAFIQSSVASSGPWLGRALRPLPGRRLQRHLRDRQRVRARRCPLPLRGRAGDGPRPAARALPGRGRPPARRLGREARPRRRRHRVRRRHLARHAQGRLGDPDGSLGAGAIPSTAGGAGGGPPGRVVRALIFADVKGFSKLADEQVPLVAAARAERLRDRARALRRRRSSTATRGATRSTSSSPTRVLAAECALELQQAIAAIDLRDAEAAGRPRAADRRARRARLPAGGARCCGRGRSRGRTSAAPRRIEPVTPPGTVYVTEPFAAALELAQRPGLGCDYVGSMPAAKDYGHFRMYRLRRRHIRSQ